MLKPPPLDILRALTFWQAHYFLDFVITAFRVQVLWWLPTFLPDHSSFSCPGFSQQYTWAFNTPVPPPETHIWPRALLHLHSSEETIIPAVSLSPKFPYENSLTDPQLKAVTWVFQWLDRFLPSLSSASQIRPDRNKTPFSCAVPHLIHCGPQSSTAIFLPIQTNDLIATHC